jgi:hypothetical protein
MNSVKLNFRYLMMILMSLIILYTYGSSSLFNLLGFFIVSKI